MLRLLRFMMQKCIALFAHLAIDVGVPSVDAARPVGILDGLDLDDTAPRSASERVQRGRPAHPEVDDARAIPRQSVGIDADGRPRLSE